MIKKRYLGILSITIVSVLLGSLFYPNLALSKEEKKPRPVEVTNFPLDGEGNLRVTQVNGDSSWEVIYVLENLEITWNTRQSTKWHLGYYCCTDAVTIGGYNRMRMFMNVFNYTTVGGTDPWYNQARIYAWAYPVFAGEDAWEEQMVAYTWIHWKSGTPLGKTLREVYPDSSMRETLEPSIRIELYAESKWGGNHSTPLPATVSCAVTVGIYLRND
jgi:hypothetical protein